MREKENVLHTGVVLRRCEYLSREPRLFVVIARGKIEEQQAGVGIAKGVVTSVQRLLEPLGNQRQGDLSVRTLARIVLVVIAHGNEHGPVKGLL